MQDTWAKWLHIWKDVLRIIKNCAKGQKILKSIFSWNSIAQKANVVLDKILPYEARSEFCQILRAFFGQWRFQEKCFWNLITFKLALFFLLIRMKICGANDLPNNMQFSHVRPWKLDMINPFTNLLTDFM